MWGFVWDLGFVLDKMWKVITLQHAFLLIAGVKRQPHLVHNETLPYDHCSVTGQIVTQGLDAATHSLVRFHKSTHISPQHSRVILPIPITPVH